MTGPVRDKRLTGAVKIMPPAVSPDVFTVPGLTDAPLSHYTAFHVLFPCVPGGLETR